MMFRLYVKLPTDKRFRPVDWNAGRQVTNLIYASLFTDSEREQLERVDLAHPNNAGLEYQFRTVAS